MNFFHICFSLFFLSNQTVFAFTLKESESSSIRDSYCFKHQDVESCISRINETLIELDALLAENSGFSIPPHKKYLIEQRMKKLIAMREHILSEQELFHIVIVPVVQGELSLKGEPMSAEMAQEINEQSEIVKKYIEGFLNPVDPNAKKMEAYTFTRSITINPKAISLSYPNLTLNTRFSDDSRMIRSILLHENLHWFIADEKHGRNVEAALVNLKKIGDLSKIPIPAGLSGLSEEKARQIIDTHLFVNWLELQADKDFMSDAEAKKLLGDSPVYNTIYPRVIRYEDEMGKVLKEFGLIVKE